RSARCLEVRSLRQPWPHHVLRFSRLLGSRATGPLEGSSLGVRWGRAPAGSYLTVAAEPEERGVTDRIRVLHVIQNLNYGGMERLFADIVRRLDPARFESHVLVLGYFGRFAEGLDQFATLHQAVPMSRFSMLIPRSLAQQIGRIAPDVI